MLEFFCLELYFIFSTWLDTAKIRSGRYRPIFIFFVFSLSLGILVHMKGYIFSYQGNDIYYFAFFLLVLPILGRIEKMKPMPIGISNSELSRDMVAAE